MKLRTRSAVAIAVAATVMLAACDSGSLNLAGLGTTVGGNGLTISPSTVSLRVGATAQLNTNATADQQSQLEWSSSNSIVAGVSPTGLVTASATGSTTIGVRLSSDTTKSATATVTVTP